ncbi:hypothetical protein KR222_005249, partial [Zaprionus bogoriensis]
NSRKMKFLLQMKVLTIFVQVLSAAKYLFSPYNEDVFTPCPDQPDNVYSIDRIFDLSALTMKMDMDNTHHITGNVTTTWNISKTDRIEAYFAILKLDRGSWVSTFLAISISDFCKVAYDKNQYWYMFWTKHIINSQDVRDNCLNVPGTILVHEPFVVDMRFDIPGSFSGRHKILGKLKAFGPRNVPRDPSACLEIIGDFESI